SVFSAAAVARRARAVGRSEAEGARLEYGQGDAAIGAGELFGKRVFFAADDSHGDEARGEFEVGGDGLREARGDARLDEQAVDHDFDGVIFALVEGREIVELVEFAVDANADVAFLREFFQLLAIGAFSSADNGREDHDAVVELADFSVQNGLYDLLAGLARDGLAAVRAVRNADRSVDDAEIIVNLRDRSDGGARGARGGFLLDGDGGRKAIDDVHFGALHLIEKLAGVGGKRLDVAALALGINGVKSTRRLAGAGETGDDRQGVPGDLDADVLQVVLARAPDYQFGQAHVTPIRRKYSLHRSPGAQWVY